MKFFVTQMFYLILEKCSCSWKSLQSLLILCLLKCTNPGSNLLLIFLLFVTGFDPWDESSKALADMIAKEASATSTHHLPGLVAPPISNSLHHTSHLPPHMLPDHRQQKPLPPGLSQNPQNHIGAFHNTSKSLWECVTLWTNNKTT